MNAIAWRPILAAAAGHLEADGYDVAVARSLDDLMQVMAIRTLVYMGEQDCPFDEEYDGNDFAGATHLLLRFAGQPVGVVRLRWFADFAKLERLAVLKDHRGRATLTLIRGAVKIARRKGYRRILGHAQPRLVAFWARHFNGRPRPGRDGFSFSGCTYTEVVAEFEASADALTLDSDPLVLLRPEGDWDRPGVLDRSRPRCGSAA